MFSINRSHLGLSHSTIMSFVGILVMVLYFFNWIDYATYILRGSFIFSGMYNIQDIIWTIYEKQYYMIFHHVVVILLYECANTNINIIHMYFFASVMLIIFEISAICTFLRPLC